MTYYAYGDYGLAGPQLFVGQNAGGTVTLTADTEDFTNVGTPMDRFIIGAGGNSGYFSGVGGNGSGYTFDIVIGDPSFADPVNGHSANISIGVWAAGSYGTLNL